MDKGSDFIFENGTSAQNALGTWDPTIKGGSIFIQTNSFDAEGP